MNENELRSGMVRITKKLDELGLNRGASGNLSARYGEGMLITPSGMGAEGLTEDDIVFVHMDGSARGRWQPSSEWLFHRDILAQRGEVGAVVHTHSIAATALACLRRDIPPFHYMIALVGGDTIRCANYATFGTQELSNNALHALRDRKACLLANHGMIATGIDLAEAFRITVEVETLSEMYLRALQAGEPVLLSAQEFQDAQQRFAGYGQAAERKQR
ncbi:MAG: Class II aldolase/adducin family protein [Candidatus Gallionella acididurans]|uniref:Class II aldolase/adducin family protein n=1 Tax=Candidatus Gallionella acididurans TaxID=1796491 RepID=A0A139BVZ3_9PROT|nr:MAG: Class II aldolase/adducin family protein [Candidatus Gallionella acididurans]